MNATVWRFEVGSFRINFQGNPWFSCASGECTVATWPRHGRLIEARIERWFPGADHGRCGARGCW